ncbi:MAG: YHYH protein [Brevirhabdus sp.]
MTTTTNRRLFLAGGAVALGLAATKAAPQAGPPRMRDHRSTKAKALELQRAAVTKTGAQVEISTQGGMRIITANGVPTHAVGRFPNAGNPNKIRAQRYRFEMPLNPSKGRARAPGRGALFGVAVNGVPFDPGAAEFWRGNPQSGWQYEALGGAVALGLDTNYGHVQPTGAYHYHGLPVGLLQQLGWKSSDASPLIGWAADGFPIYAMTARVKGGVQRMHSSWRLKSGQRPGGSGPGGNHDGAFVQDFEYVAGSGSLDEANGAVVRTDEYPDGTYAYFLTQEFPVIPRLLSGVADPSFRKRRGGGPMRG